MVFRVRFQPSILLELTNICPTYVSALGYARNVRSCFEQGGTNVFKKTSDKRVAAFFATPGLLDHIDTISAARDLDIMRAPQ